MHQEPKTRRKVTSRANARSVQSSPEQPSHTKLGPLTTVTDRGVGRSHSKRSTHRIKANGRHQDASEFEGVSRAYLASNSENAASLSDKDASDNSSSTLSAGDEISDSEREGLLRLPRRLFSTSSPRRPSAEITEAATNVSGSRLGHMLVEKPHQSSGFSHMLDPLMRNSPSQLYPRGIEQISRSGSPGPGSSSLSRKRVSSPAPQANPQTNSGKESPEPPTKRPFYTFRWDLLPEVGLLTSSMVLACWRISSLPLSEVFPPAAPLIIITLLMPLISLIRRPAHASQLMVPFTDERGYRDRSQADDGFACGVSLPIMLAAGCVWEAHLAHSRGQYLKFPNIRDLTELWALNSQAQPLPDAVDLSLNLLDGRTALLVLTTLNSFVLIVHLILARTFLAFNWLPISNTRRLIGAVSLASTLSLTAGCTVAVCAHYGHSSPWIGPTELTISSFMYQVALYLISRLARRAFTLGELAIATASGISLFLEFSRLTMARWLYHSTHQRPQTFRAPTPIIAYQHMLILGAFVAGFILGPLLNLSRQMASMPARKLRWPSEREHNRKLIAGGTYLGLVAIVILLYGGWLTYMLGGSHIRKPWSWALRYTFYGGDAINGMHGQFRGWPRWRRFTLASYWLGTITLAVGGWQTRLVRARRLKPAAGHAASATSKTGIEGLREEKRVHVRLDLRRKFFHALAVVMFLPGIALDPAFTSLAFALAFSLFTFAEYARYFALYPFGASIHVFFNEFVDNKDAGPVILSHFYLLTGCAGGVWLEGAGIKRFAGVLAIGIGDACASLLGRRIGGPRWPGRNKTFAGSLAFVLSINAAAFGLVASGLCEPFNKSDFLIATCCAALLEAVSSQHDNLTVPIFFGALLALLES